MSDETMPDLPDMPEKPPSVTTADLLEPDIKHTHDQAQLLMNDERAVTSKPQKQADPVTVTTSQVKGREYYAPAVPESVVTQNIREDKRTGKRILEHQTSAGFQKLNPYLREVIRDGAWDGQTVYIVGGGPSAAEFPFERLRGALVIGTNRAAEVVPFATMMVSMDIRFWHWMQDPERMSEKARNAWTSFEGVRVMIHKAERETLSGDISGKPIYSLQKASKNQKSCLKTGIYQGNSSGFAAMQIARTLGAKRIVLIGFDMKGDGDKQKWWHDGYPVVQNEDVYEIMRKDYEYIAPILEAEKVDVRIVGDSALSNVFTPTSIETALSFIPEDPVTIVGYATEGTPYVDELDKMAQTANLFGFQVQKHIIKNHGSWQANTYAKSSLLWEICKDNRGKRFAYVDADARFCAYPELFQTFREDLLVPMVNWAGYPISRNDIELLTGTMAFRCTNNTQAFFYAWKLECKKVLTAKKSSEFEQAILARLLASKQYKLKVGNMPDTYCQIFDLMRAAGDPVILQTQASRKFKKLVGVMEAEE